MAISRSEVEMNGRWFWTFLMLNDDAKTGKTAQSPIGFPTREQAAADAEIHLKSVPDGKGRSVRTKEQIADLLRVAAAACEECTGVAFADPQWQEADAEGCNWYISSGNGADVSGCADCVIGDVTSLRAVYNIPDEA